MSDSDYAIDFWNEVRHHWGIKGAAHLERLYRSLADSRHSVAWGRRDNEHLSFVVTVPEFSSTEYLRVYSDGILHFYTSKLADGDSTAFAFRDSLNKFNKEWFSANIDNKTMYLVQFEAWLPHADKLATFLRSLMRPTA